MQKKREKLIIGKENKLISDINWKEREIEIIFAQPNGKDSTSWDANDVD